MTRVRAPLGTLRLRVLGALTLSLQTTAEVAAAAQLVEPRGLPSKERDKVGMVLRRLEDEGFASGQRGARQHEARWQITDAGAQQRRDLIAALSVGETMRALQERVDRQIANLRSRQEKS